MRRTSTILNLDPSVGCCKYCRDPTRCRVIGWTLASLVFGFLLMILPLVPYFDADGACKRTKVTAAISKYADRLGVPGRCSTYGFAQDIAPLLEMLDNVQNLTEEARAAMENMTIPGGREVYPHAVYLNLSLGCILFIASLLVIFLLVCFRSYPLMFKIATCTHYLIALLMFIGVILNVYVIADFACPGGLKECVDNITTSHTNIPDATLMLAVCMVFELFAMVGSAFFGCCLWHFDKAQQKAMEPMVVKNPTLMVLDDGLLDKPIFVAEVDHPKSSIEM